MDADANAGAMPPPAPRGRAAEEEPDQDEETEEEQEENTGQWSPRALEPEHVPLGQDVIPEEEDARLLELLRAQVRRRSPVLARGQQPEGCVVRRVLVSPRAWLQ